MPVDKDIKKVLIIGSGPIQIGQAAKRILILFYLLWVVRQV